MSLAQYLRNVRERGNQIKVEGLQQTLPFLDAMIEIKHEERMRQLADEEDLKRRERDLQGMQDWNTWQHNQNMGRADEIARSQAEASNVLFDNTARHQAMEEAKIQNEVQGFQRSSGFIANQQVDDASGAYLRQRAVNSANDADSQIIQQRNDQQLRTEALRDYRRNIGLVNNIRHETRTEGDKTIEGFTDGTIFHPVGSRLGNIFVDAFKVISDFESDHPMVRTVSFLERNAGLVENDIEIIDNLTKDNGRPVGFWKGTKNKNQRAIDGARKRIEEFQKGFDDFLGHEINHGGFHRMQDIYNYLREVEGFDRMNVVAKYRAINMFYNGLGG
jgi:hypothetical protein